MTNEELLVLDLINRAIDHDLVTPFYQGIHNNISSKIDKYESLMRIVDLDEKIYAPFTFMEISKRYKMYNHISRKMIGKVLDDFTLRNEEISINISLYDIDSSSFRRWFIERIAKFPSPERVIIEVVESDDFKDVDVFFEFINQVKALGCKIAIDDFGSGYSTFSTVLQLEPDYIKIDGSIISLLSVDEKSVAVLDTIQYLAEKLGAKTVAEFVENIEIQRILEQYRIAYSQGYYYSKPQPLVDL